MTTNKPRAATIRCLSTTHLMVLSKHDYKQVLLRFEEANLNKSIDFLKNLPPFRNWTKNALSRLTYYMHRKIYLRNQIVYKEGSECTFAYVVLDGEFEITKKMWTPYDEMDNWHLYVGPEDDREKADKNKRREINMLKKAG